MDESTTTTQKTPSSSSLRLRDCICLVTGASRGIGKGIAMELAAEGATVYITGTSSSSNPSTEPGTIEDTAEEIHEMFPGGRCIPIVCDHSKDDQVMAVFRRIGHDHGRLDILINNAFRLPAGGVPKLYQKFWHQGAETWDAVHTVGLRSHYIATSYAMPLLFKSRDSLPQRRQNNNNNTKLPRPFIGMVSSFGGLCYTFNVPYGVGKAAVDRLAKDMAVELMDEDIAVVSFWPGLVDTERTQRSVANGEWDKYVRLPLDDAESPRFTGRAMVEVALDQQNLQRYSGTYQVVAELAQKYKFNDPVTLKTPPSIRSLKFLLPAYGMDAETRAKVPKEWIPDWKLPFWIMAQGQPPRK